MPVRSIGDAVISTDAAGHIEYLNPVAERLTAWSLDEARGRPLADVLHVVDEVTREPVENGLAFSSLSLGGAPRTGGHDHAVLITRTGQEIAIQESAAPICDRSGELTGMVVVFHDVTQERRLKRALSYQASHDALTGLINRREFENRLHAALLGTRRGEVSGALLFIDLDRFKLVNDACGHPAGDRLLREVTQLLQSRVRASDVIARLGGDEFGVLLDACAPDQVLRIADGIRQSVRDYRFVWGGQTFEVGASIGVLMLQPDTDSVAEMLNRADAACYAAKSAGRNRIHVHEGAGTPTRSREMPWVTRIARAPEEGRLELLFQPIMGAGPQPQHPFHELTVRLRDEDGTLVAPAEFMSAAERYGVMSRVDRWVLGQAVQLLEERARRRQPLPLLALNLSGTSLSEPSFAQFVMQRVPDAALAASLCFEVTEAVAVGALSGATVFMRELKARGFRFTLDDFGSGMSSFTYLKTLPVDFLKVDGQFTAHVASDPVDRAMVEAIAKAARALGIATIAGYVESTESLEALREIGVDFVQGFVLAPPAPIAELG